MDAILFIAIIAGVYYLWRWIVRKVRNRGRSDSLPPL